MYHNQIRTLSSSPCQLGLGVVLKHLSLSPYKYTSSRTYISLNRGRAYILLGFLVHSG